MSIFGMHFSIRTESVPYSLALRSNASMFYVIRYFIQIDANYKFDSRLMLVTALRMLLLFDTKAFDSEMNSFQWKYVKFENVFTTEPQYLMQRFEFCLQTVWIKLKWI